MPRIDLERGTMSIERVLSFRGRPVPARTAYPDNIVVFEGLADPDNPRNFSTARKSALVALFGLTTAGSQFCSSVLSSGAAQISREFGVGTEVVILVTSLCVYRAVDLSDRAATCYRMLWVRSHRICVF